MLFRQAFIFVSIVLAVALLLTGCEDPPPGEVTGRVTVDGRTIGVTVKAVNDKGEVVDQDQSLGGVYSLKGLKPGHYTIEFYLDDKLIGSEEVDVDPGGSHPVMADF